MNCIDIFPIDKWNFKSESILLDLPKEDLELLMANCTEQTYSKGEVIFRECAVPSGIFYIKEGKVKKYKVDSEGRERIVYVAAAGELIGYHAVLAEERFPDSAAPLEESKIAFIPKEDFLATLQQSDVLSRRLLKTLSHEFAVLVNSLSIFGQKSVRERLALQLVLLDEKYKVNVQPDTEVEINISRSDLANLVGTARENVVRLLSEFKQDGLVSTHGRRIRVNHPEQLISIANFK
jgi:CRP-like cAMP-binding protein